jgi:hypothetical protein
MDEDKRKEPPLLRLHTSSRCPSPALPPPELGRLSLLIAFSLSALHPSSSGGSQPQLSGALIPSKPVSERIAFSISAHAQQVTYPVALTVRRLGQLRHDIMAGSRVVHVCRLTPVGPFPPNLG